MSSEVGGEKAVVDAYGRLKGVQVIKPIVYGNTARYLHKKLDNGHTHSWTLFLRPYLNEEAHRWIRKVTFKLHDSYANQTRVVEAPPYEVQETGWGEFEVLIKVYFVDPNEKPVQTFHILKLFQNDPACIAGTKPVVSEFYDEIIFVEPSSFLYQRLSATQGKPVKAGHDTDFEEKKRRTLQLLATARTEAQGCDIEVRGEIGDLSKALREARTLLQELADKTRALEEAPPTPSTAFSAPSPAVSPFPPPMAPFPSQPTAFPTLPTVSITPSPSASDLAPPTPPPPMQTS